MSNSNTIQALWIALGTLSNVAISIVSAMILSRYFDKSDYGTYRQILYVYNTLLVVFNAGLPKVFAFFLPRYSLEEGKNIVWKLNKLLFLLGGAFSVVLYLAAPAISDLLNNDSLSNALKIFAPVPFLLLPTIGIEGIFTSYKKSVYIAIYNVITRSILLVSIILPIILIEPSVEMAIIGWLVGATLSFIIALFFKNIPFKTVKNVESVLSYKEILTYSLPLVGATLSGVAIRSADQFYISRYFGEEIFAEFSNGFTPLPFVSIVIGSASMVLLPVFSKLSIDSTKVNEVALLFRTTLNKSALLIYPAVLFFMFYAEPVIIILYSDLYENSVLFFQIFLFLNFFNVIVFAPLLLALGETKFYAKIHFYFAIVAWIGGYAVVSIYPDPYVLAAFSILNTITIVIIAMNKSAKLLKLRIQEMIDFKQLIKILFHCMLILFPIVCCLEYLLTPNQHILKLLLAISIYTPLLLLSSKYFKLDYLLALKPIIEKVTTFMK